MLLSWACGCECPSVSCSANVSLRRSVCVCLPPRNASTMQQQRLQDTVLKMGNTLSFANVGALAKDALGHASREACDELAAAGVALASIDGAPLEGSDAVSRLLCFPELLLGPSPHVLLWVQVWRMCGPIRQRLHAPLCHGSLGVGSMHALFTIEEHSIRISIGEGVRADQKA